MSQEHILIIGAGLAGPALAIALSRRNIKCTIFEIRPAISESGGSITLAANAIRSLHILGGDELYSKIKETGYTYTRMTAYLDTGYRYGELEVGEEGEGGYPAIRIMRTALNRLLVGMCEEEGVKVVWGKVLTEIKEDEKGVEASFEDGEVIRGTFCQCRKS